MITRTSFAFVAALSLWLTFAQPVWSQQPDGASIYQLDSTWRDKDGRTVKLADLEGKVRVLAMGYTSCPYACPRILADMRAIQRALPKADLSRVEFTFVSFDPGQDTPARLREFQAKNDLNSWLFLTGDNEGVLELSVALGIKVQKTGAGGFAHSNGIFVLASDGSIIHHQEELGIAPNAAVKSILKALR